MAANLRAKIPPGDKLLVNDKDQGATSAFIEAHQAGQGSDQANGVEMVTDVREVAERSVRIKLLLINFPLV